MKIVDMILRRPNREARGDTSQGPDPTESREMRELRARSRIALRYAGVVLKEVERVERLVDRL
jgi:hypothetical protein